MRGHLRRVLCSLVAATTLSGCVSLQTPITDFATDYNRVIADTRNEMILLNILRAQHREPLYYSSVSQIEGAVSIEGRANLELGLVDDGNPMTDNADTTKPSLGVTMSSEPTFTVVPLNSNEFVRGALSPIRDGTVRLLLSQGWRSSALAPLLVERIECDARPTFGAISELSTEERDALTASNTDSLGAIPDNFNSRVVYAMRQLDELESGQSSGESHSLENDPEIYRNHLWFYEIFPRIQFRPDEREGESFTVSLSGNDLVDFLTAERASAFRTSESSVVGNAKPHADSNGGATTSLPAYEITANATQIIVAQLPASISVPSDSDGRRVNIPLELYCPGKGEDIQVDSNGTSSRSLRLRSTQGIIYFLGELLRADITAPNVENWIPFDVQEGDGRAAVAIRYRGQRYFISEHSGNAATESSDRSLRILSLINQLLALQTSTEDLTRANSSVRVR